MITIANHLFDPIHWNAVCVLLFFCSFATFFLFVERLLYVKKAEMDTDRFLIEFRSLLEKGDFSSKDLLAFKEDKPIKRIILAAMKKQDQGLKKVKEQMELQAHYELSKLEKNVGVLSLIAHIAPLLGLLGTVIGFIQVFSEMRLSGLVDISATAVGEAMEYALVTTAFGLVVAIPATLGYNFLVYRIKAFILDIQTTTNELIDLLEGKDAET